MKKYNFFKENSAGFKLHKQVCVCVCVCLVVLLTSYVLNVLHQDGPTRSVLAATVTQDVKFKGYT